MDWLTWFVCVVLPPLFLVWYIKLNDKALEQIPKNVLSISPKRTTPEDVRAMSARMAKAPLSIDHQIPPKTGRRYIIIGGAGFLGGWIVIQLLKRGEDPKRIRVLDLRSPSRSDLKTGAAKEVEFVQMDVSDPAAVEAAFHAPWPETESDATDPNPKITVIHTAANIRFYERHFALVPRSAKVNVNGTQNVIDSARSIGASTLIYTSSASIPIHSSWFFLWPWKKEPKFFVQAISDDTPIPTRHQDFFSNYAYTKFLAEKRVREADKSPSGNGVLRTGCIRPGNGIFGPGGDMLCGAYLIRKNNPSWISTIVQNFIYVENCAVAHLCYEQRLVELDAGSKNPDIGGDTFIVTDPGSPPTYGDVYCALNTLTDGEATFPTLSPTGMLIMAYAIEWLYLGKQLLLTAGFSTLAKLIPGINGDLVNLQPSLWNLTMVHAIFDDYRARLSPEKGGLGYKGVWNTMEGLWETAEAHKRGVAVSDRSHIAGVGFGFVKAQRGVARMGEKVAEELGVDPVQALSGHTTAQS